MAFPSAENSVPHTRLPPPEIEAVLFDYGQVLSLPPDPSAWARIRTITGLAEDALHAAYWHFRHDYDRAALTGPAYWRAVAHHAGISLTDSQLADLLAADVDLWTRLNTPMVHWAARLQHAGISTGILSNIGDSIAEGILARLPWLSGFSTRIWSHTLFMAKPEPAIFLYAVEALQTTPAHILFLDDREENIAAAAAVGMQTLHYTTHPRFEHEMQERGLTALLYADQPSETIPPVGAHK